jgi:hypothetical protein
MKASRPLKAIEAIVLLLALLWLVLLLFQHL